MTGEFFSLPIRRVVKETPSAIRIEFDVPDTLRPRFQWHAGQHVTLRLEVKGEELRRSYSICVAPDVGQPLQIAVKRVEDGRASTYLNESAQPGVFLDVSVPFGGFCLRPDPKKRRTYYMFAAGSGITPIISMAQAALVREPDSVVKLVVGNRDEQSVMFRERLETWSVQFGDRLVVAHVLSAGGSRSSSVWRQGRIDDQAVRDFIAQQPPIAQDTQYYICGPGEMNALVRRCLLDVDVPKSRVHIESFGGMVEVDERITGVDSHAIVQLKGRSLEVFVESGQTVLQALRRDGHTPPYSCESGVCGACRATITGGKVEMRARMALNDDEIEDGAVLTCQAVPTTDQIEVTYESS